MFNDDVGMVFINTQGQTRRLLSHLLDIIVHEFVEINLDDYFNALDQTQNSLPTAQIPNLWEMFCSFIEKPPNMQCSM